MAKSYKELLAERENLEVAIAAAWESERHDAMTYIRALIAQFDIAPAHLVANSRTRASRYAPKKSGRYVPKYRDPVSGATWSGKGREPRWIVGHDRAAFEITRSAPLSQVIESE